MSRDSMQPFNQRTPPEEPPKDPRSYVLDYLTSVTFPSGEILIRFDQARYDADWEAHCKFWLAEDRMLVGHHMCTNKSPSSARLVLDRGSPSDIFTLIGKADALRRAGIRTIDLLVLYLPYGRQDRVATRGDSFILPSVVKILKMHFRNIKVVDPHSDVTPAVFDSFNAQSAVRIIHQVDVMHAINNQAIKANFQPPFSSPAKRTRPLTIVAPDQGSVRKAEEVFRQSEADVFLRCLKHRDPKTGKLSGFEVLATHEEKAKVLSSDVVIVDDLIDGGGTFFGLREQLQLLKPHSMSLAVSAGIFSGELSMQRLATAFDYLYVGDLICGAETRVQPDTTQPLPTNFFNASIRNVF